MDVEHRLNSMNGPKGGHMNMNFNFSEMTVTSS